MELTMQLLSIKNKMKTNYIKVRLPVRSFSMIF